ncbi:hypothetical protein ACIQUO_10445 [Streptomyces albogriseolus]|nr:hypothetical protein [Streptomyces viridodiastaticus]MCX4566757.1 hypothetical protein [Streptomyces viridodiastaticus]
MQDQVPGLRAVAASWVKPSGPRSVLPLPSSTRMQSGATDPAMES